MSERVLTDKITMRPYGDDGWAFSDDGCGCGAGGLAVMQTGGEPFAVEQHIAGCGDDDLPARVIVALAARVAELEAENAKLRKCVEEADAMREEITCPNTGDKEPAENCCDACWSMIHYDAAREEVDK